MVYILLFVLGLCLGSFINALVWRIYKADELKRQKIHNRAIQQNLSIVHGRSMCTHCQHILQPRDLIPVISYILLRGKCRYCNAKINDTPFTEIVLPILFLLSYATWPYATNGWDQLAIAMFIVWLFLLTIYLALAVYDVKWYILPNSLVASSIIIAITLVSINSMNSGNIRDFIMPFVAAAFFFTIFYIIFAVSNEKWLGGGDVKLALSLGLIAGSLHGVLLVIFIASLLATLLALPNLVLKRMSTQSLIPYGPYLISAGIVVFLWGEYIFDWYMSLM